MAETELTLAKKVHIYSNGDRFFTGRRFVINPRQTRNYESFLTQVTHSLKPAFGAVRVLRTPENGHAVADLTDLETGRSYVACAQKFVKLGYEEITTKPKPAPSPERRNKVIASGRIKKIERHPIAIFVYANNQPLEPAKRILLQPWVHKTWETVLVAISEKINLVNGAVRQVFDLATKEEVTQGIHLKNNEYYVAVGSERFKDLEYGMQATVLSPKQQQKRRYPVLRPVRKKNSSDDSQGLSPLESSTTSSNSIGKKSDESPAVTRRKVTQNTTNNEEGIPIKPVKHKRGSSDKAKELAAGEAKEKPSVKPAARQHPTNRKPASKTTVDLDKASPRKDEGGVFKAKGKKQKATEVHDDRNVKEEIPIDRRKAHTVEDQQLESPRKKEPLPPVRKNKQKNEPQKKSPPKKQPETKAADEEDKEIHTEKKSKRPPSQQSKVQAAITIQAGYRGYKTRKELKNQKMESNKAEKSENTVGKDDKDEREKSASDEREKSASDEREKSASDEKEKAAIKIQSTYRGYRVRKSLKSKKKEDSKADQKNAIDEEREKAAIKIQATYRGYRTRKVLKKSKLDKKEPNGESPSKRDAAATTIQAGYRGYQVRKRVKLLKEQKANGDAVAEEARAQSSQSATNDEKERAALKIQANFRGYKTRKSVSRARQ